MRSLRDIQTIVRDYPLAPDEYDLRRLCHAHLEGLQQPDDITDWIDREPNPYLRELYATYTTLLIKEYCADGMMNNSYGMWEPVYEELNHIARRAFGEQLSDNLYHAEKNAYTQPLQEAVVHTVPLMQKLQEQMDYLSERMDDVERKLSSADDDPHWPYYTSQAKEEDKQFFEMYLRKICSTPSKNRTQQIHNYLNIKEKEKLITRPVAINEEYKIIKTFGYNLQEKTYYNS